MPIISHIKKLYKTIYILGNKLPKSDKLGIHKKIEEYSLHLLAMSIESAFRPKLEKLQYLKEVRLKTEVLKHLIRTEYELKIIPEKQYLLLAENLQNISMMANGWMKSITQNPPQ